ncbi:hypothetical protein FisN_3Lh048 [Fistulifera solaris]|uniref:Uncharacterized protein n=1 Tax=Fistulifera solaris TaxID=1519565 RepID=A0A1Z5JYW7_FISSO|nr:hypothetical protein FisN_3Lh048 [Fistulifera solaris]|eukprot:GAX19109.1 hypothetical protein FisN_3Lh048 [Fistulifera solaris]
MNNNPKLEFSAEEEEEAPWYRAFIFSDVRPHDFIEAAKTRAPKEIGCAFAASFLVSPLVSIIDKCIVQDISGSGKFIDAIKKASHEMVAQPRTFFGGLSFRLTFAVYFGTYAVANLAEMFLDVQKIRDDETRKQRKVAASAVANISLLAWRDSVFAKAFGNAEAAKRKTPLRTFGLFAARDTATMYATFYAAPRAAKYLEHERGWERNTAELSMALAIPVATQVLTAPIHIHAMDYFNVPKATTAERFATIKKEFNTVSFARGLRILPAFGIGSFSNNKFRELFIRGQDESKFYRKRLTTLYDAARRNTTKASN